MTLIYVLGFIVVVIILIMVITNVMKKMSREKIKNINVIDVQSKLSNLQDAEMLAMQITSKIRFQNNIKDDEFIKEFQDHINNGNEGFIIKESRKLADQCPNLAKYAKDLIDESKGKNWKQLRFGSIILLLLYCDLHKYKNGEIPSNEDLLIIKN